MTGVRHFWPQHCRSSGWRIWSLDRGQHYAELGLSVEPAHRGNGYGITLLNRGKVERGDARLTPLLFMTVWRKTRS